MQFNEKLKNLRILKGITQKEMADKMGIHIATYSGYEIGRRYPDVPKIKKIINILNIEAEELFESSKQKKHIKAIHKFETYIKALSELEKISNNFDYTNSILRDALIQRFKSTLDACWEILEYYLEYKGVTAFKTTLASKIKDNYITWFNMTNDMKIVSHVYDKPTAIDVSNSIIKNYIPLLKKLTKDIDIKNNNPKINK